MCSMDYAALYEQFSQSPWLARIGEPEEQARTMGNRDEMSATIENDPDAFYAPPYQKPYEDLCCADHARAGALTNAANPAITDLARQAHSQAWQHCPDAEVCALLADDVETIATLLIHRQALTAFTRERIGWYIKGRMPWGYHGKFPEGQWLVL
jgi:hypothetical protein